MKKIGIAVFSLCMLTGSMGKAQTLDSKYGLDSAETVRSTSLYTELWKQKNYEEALPFWRYVFLNAPAFRQTTYTRGEDIIEYMLKKTKQKEYLDTLMMIHDQRIKYFGNDPRFGEGYIMGKKGVTLLRFGDGSVATKKEAMHYFLKEFEMRGERVMPMTLNNLILVAKELATQSEYSKDEFINLYMRLTDFTDKLIPNLKEKRLADFQKCREALDVHFFDSGLADCETLNNLLTKKLEAHPDSLPVLKEISSILNKMECTDIELYTKVAEAIYQKAPDGEAAYGLAVTFLQKKEVEKAEQYFKEAAEKSEDTEVKSKAYLRLAHLSLTKKNYQQTKRHALEVLKLTPTNGKAYIYIGQAYAYAAPSYSTEDFFQRTVYWAAVDKFVKAKQVDPSVAEEANKLIKSFSDHFPDKGEAFFRSINSGASVKIESWINETTTARFKDK